MQLRRRGHYWGLGLLLTAFLLGVSSVGAEGASSIAQGFKTDDKNVIAGALVSLKQGTANTVELATAEKLEQLMGVAGSMSLIELSDGLNSVKVVTSGNTPAIVSDINGAIKTGDKITASPLAGVGMKATRSTLIIGTAQANLSEAVTQDQSLTDKDGKKSTVKIGIVNIQVDKVFYQSTAGQNSFLPPVLQDFADNLAGRPVSPVRVMVAGALVLFMFTAVVIMVYSSVKSSIISIGRNPLSEGAILKSLLQVGLTVIGILAFGAIVIYLLLTV